MYYILRKNTDTLIMYRVLPQEMIWHKKVVMRVQPQEAEFKEISNDAGPTPGIEKVSGS